MKRVCVFSVHQPRGHCSQGCQIGREIWPNLATLICSRIQNQREQQAANDVCMNAGLRTCGACTKHWLP